MKPPMAATPDASASLSVQWLHLQSSNSRESLCLKRSSNCRDLLVICGRLHAGPTLEEWRGRALLVLSGRAILTPDPEEAPMRQFKWIEWNLQEIDAHGLSPAEVEAACDDVFS